MEPRCYYCICSMASLAREQRRVTALRCSTVPRNTPFGRSVIAGLEQADLAKPACLSSLTGFKSQRHCIAAGVILWKHGSVSEQINPRPRSTGR
ncbi:hypothetical protein SKAU_G00123000 [Synaphobranchus kaupii]|uniref:Uncharacterized protein n=1 Tax=Synaphobranchus kaupii TaxID=118154 RepID=A0A9Q1J1M0_SYNKA|nr:hypothetical protein SKAU_G00123000 [Synaphobranchus kaupii]